MRATDPAETSGGGTRAWSPWLKTGLMIVAGLAAIWLVCAITLANVYRARQPAFALSLAGFDAGARARLAFATIEKSRSDAAVARARSLAQGALARDPTATDALRTLGLIAVLEKRPANAQRLFEYSERMSRRDIATQLWLIEWNVARNNVAGALAHFDVALRTSFTRGGFLYPILIGASGDPQIAGPLNAVLRKRPNWWRTFVEQLIVETKTPATIATVTAGLLNPRLAKNRPLFAALIQRHVRDEDYLRAWTAYEAASAGRARTLPYVRHGNFEVEPGFAPFEWVWADDPELTPQRMAKEAAPEDWALVLAPSDATGVAARQLLLLPPGRYRLSADVGDVSGRPDDRPRLAISCAGSAQRILSETPFPEAGQDGRRLTANLAVPNNCVAQWLAIEQRGGGAGAASSPWIDSISIAKAV